MATHKISFWNFIRQNTIEIPIIQRDYAQGRVGKEHLRASFLKELKEALDKKQLLKLDFVYGSQENNHLQPLDGQQRLTTLWLLHWYIALKAKKLKEESEKLKNFSYETRISSREFCKKLCEADFTQFIDGNIVDFITQQTWFYSSWKQDPTIQAMLSMLGGTTNEEEAKDNIEAVFKGGDFNEYWTRLTSEEAPIVFYYQPLKDFGLSDDLYIKMNARGKQLTPFENFKADLIGYVEQQAKENEEWKKLLDAYRGIPILLDTDWMDIFWKNKSNYEIDEIYYAFLNRFFWNYYVGYSKETGSKIELTSVYKYLNKDNYATYESLENYTDNEGIPLELFEDLQKVLNNFGKYSQDKLLKEVIPNAQWEAPFFFIPEYDNKGGIIGVNQLQRIIFFAICKYFKEGEGDENSLKRWMRVVWNLVSGEDIEGLPQIRSIDAVKKVIDSINKLESHRVYESIQEIDLQDSSSESDEEIGQYQQRWNEEIEKAKKICEDITWEEKIIKAENYAFFRGSIRFLFRDAQGNIDWNLFEQKWKNVQKYFKDKKVGKKESAMNEAYDNSSLLKALISRFDTSQYNSVLYWWYRVFNNRPNTWSYYLLHQDITEPIHQLLLGNDKPKELQPSEDIEKNTIYQLSNTGLLDFVIEKMPHSWIRLIHNHLAIYPSGVGIFLNAKDRDDFLLKDIEVSLKPEIVVGNREYLYGWDIDFEYKNYNYRWYSNDYVYLLNNEGRCIAKQSSEGESYEECYYCFKYNKEKVKEVLQKIKEEYEKDTKK
ncbi:DUF262 domain-containing protein [Capnocytophaga leadbetteri]|uniref:DUF262 domain-containing protein n=1 Tax=Capnocytophaga leadbetteri TaxID=327575 RepID=UPI0026EA3841|nr:DUF262 domain-containing protein [Capnocytophaga leadbetteri]